MNNKKCVNCGFINFASAESCRKCQAGLFDLDGPLPGYMRQDSSVGSYQASVRGSSPSALKVVVYMFLGLILVSGVAGGARALLKPASKVAWREFYPPQAGFNIMMPAEATTQAPIVTPMPNGNLTNNVYTSVVPGQGSVLFCVVSFSGNFSTRDVPYDRVLKLLDDELNNLLRKTNSTLVSKKGIVVGGIPGLEFELRPPGNLALKDPRGFGKILLMNNQEYVFLVTASEGSDLLNDKDKFLQPPSW